MPIYTIPPSVSFVDALAQGIYHQYGDDPLEFSKLLILLPNRRSCRVLRDAFLRVRDGRPLILPAIRPIGDTDESELALGGEGLDIPPAISHTKRRVLLARLIEEWHEPKGGINHDQAMRLAIALVQFLDEVQREQLFFAKLADLVPEELASHWQVTLDFLNLLSSEWPKILEKHGLLDPVERRNRLLAAQVAQWKKSPPQYPVIAAGTTGSMPATRALLRTILDLPQGSIILPGLDMEMGRTTWDMLDESHPQYGMKELLEALGYLRKHVEPWPSPRPSPGGRGKLLAEAMLPAAAVAEWRDVKLSPESVEGLACIEANTLHEEATVIALIMRQVLETPGKTAALVTNERRLARQVISILKHWDVQIDDSAGRPMTELPAVVFLRLIVQAVVQRFSAVPFLALLKHPLMTAALEPGECRRCARLLERKVLRGPRIGGGIKGYREALLQSALKNEDKKMLAEWLSNIEKTCGDFVRLLQEPEQDCSVLIEKHLACAETLAGGAERLWHGNEGAEIRSALEEILEGTKGYCMNPYFYADILENLFSGRVYRSPYGTHPRLAILSPVEARLQHFDTVILGGMNEGSWPDLVSSPWMSRPMSKHFGLPTQEHHTGMAAHDFMQCCHAEKVFITRALKMDGVPTLPSPFLYRLDTLLKAAGLHEKVYDGEAQWLHWARKLHDGGGMPTPILPPEPRPPREARPREFYVTTIEKLMRDPYSVYARHILKLKPLEEIDKEPEARDFGSLIHHILERFVKNWENIPEAERYQTLLDYGSEAFRNMSMGAGMVFLWWPRFERIAAWFAATEIKRREVIRKVQPEIEGKIVIGDFTLKARADRIEENREGKISIMDYKTGDPPKKKDIAAGLAPQLVLEAMVAEEGGFPGMEGKRTVDAVHYWKLAGTSESAEVYTYSKELQQWIVDAREGLARLFKTFDSAETPYHSCPDRDQAMAYNDYEHLARAKEWSNI